jgi:hypothetical protein
LKATKLKNEGSAASSDELEKKALNMMLQHLDSTKYYRVKVGFSGRGIFRYVKTTIKKKKWIKRKKSNQLSVTKANLDAFLLETDFLRSDKLDFIKNKAV